MIIAHKIALDPNDEQETYFRKAAGVARFARMLKNHPLARAVADMGFGEFRRQLEYKAVQRGKMVVVVDRWYPSSKTCASCGYKVPKMPLAVRAWTCPACHTHHDRDINAAINLRIVAETSFTASPGDAARGSAPVSA